MQPLPVPFHVPDGNVWLAMDPVLGDFPDTRSRSLELPHDICQLRFQLRGRRSFPKRDCHRDW